ncbi:ribokinase [Aureimonas endophytica]|uniref:Ribokinase n=1 Tax=Aureimonas endophytica TaxID=2027858 RepID=A0A917E6H0_9HYPH|nr:ribokinase [Aureimonas endophytica]GGE05263.1 ribokinase [Aureimonas endophytica]
MHRPEKPVVVVVGSLHYDVMIDAPHRPHKGETVTGYAWSPKFGGKGGNQAVSAARSGTEVRMVGAVGDDEFGRFLLAALEASSVDGTRIMRMAGMGSGMSVAITDTDGDYGAVIVSGANLHVDTVPLAEPSLWHHAKALILQNEIPDAVNLAAARAAKAAGVFVCLNAAPFRPLPDELATLVDILVVNAFEAEALGGLPVTDLPSAAESARALAIRFSCVVVTAGGEGVAAAECANDARIALPARPVEIVSTHGAGDSFVGALVAALVSGSSFAESLAEANEIAARHVSGLR